MTVFLLLWCPMVMMASCMPKIRLTSRKDSGLISLQISALHWLESQKCFSSRYKFINCIKFLWNVQHFWFIPRHVKVIGWILAQQCYLEWQKRMLRLLSLTKFPLMPIFLLLIPLFLVGPLSYFLLTTFKRYLSSCIFINCNRILLMAQYDQWFLVHSGSLLCALWAWARRRSPLVDDHCFTNSLNRLWVQHTTGF